MSVYKCGKSWKAEIHWKGLRIKTKSGFKTKKEAKLWHDAQLKLYITNQQAGVIPDLINFRELCHRFREFHLPTVRSGTARRYEIDLKHRIEPFFGDMKLQDINQLLVEEFKIQIIKNLSPKSVNNCFEVLKAVFNKAVEWKMMQENPASHINMQKIPDRKYQWWDNKEDIAKFLKFAKNDPYHLAYRLGLECGLRLGEIIGLSKSDINLHQCRIHIHRQWLEKERNYGPTKQGRERYIGFSKNSVIYQLLEKALQNRPFSEIVFFNSKGNRLGGSKLSNYHFQKLVKLSGVPRIRFHDLRHTFASWFMITTDNIWDLKNILGHADIQMTQKYAHLSLKHRLTPDFDWGE